MQIQINTQNAARIGACKVLNVQMRLQRFSVSACQSRERKEKLVNKKISQFQNHFYKCVLTLILQFLFVVGNQKNFIRIFHFSSSGEKWRICFYFIWYQNIIYSEVLRHRQTVTSLPLDTVQNLDSRQIFTVNGIADFTIIYLNLRNRYSKNSWSPRTLLYY